MCQPCLIEDHREQPYHRVEVWDWTAKHFRQSSLHQAGLIIHFGHSGRPCSDFDLSSIPTGRNSVTERLYGRLPNPPPRDDAGLFCVSESLEPELIKLPDIALMDDIPDEEDEREEGNPWEDTDPRWGNGNTRTLLIGHTNGFHIHTVRFCRCQGHSADWQQMLSSRIWPATFGRPQTGFTLECLRDFRYSNAVSKASASSYHSKLQKQTGQGVIVQCPVSFTFLKG